MDISRIAWLLAATLAVAWPQSGSAADDWEIILERDGIVVRRREVEGQALPQLRAAGIVPGHPYEVLAVLLDVPAHVAWRPDCAESRMVRRIDEWHSLTYTRTDVPWPLRDRDVVVATEVEFVDPPSSVKVSFRAVEAPDIERSHRAIRMTRATGIYAVEATGDGRSQVHYEVDADPGGSLPDWFISLQSTRNPFETLAGLRRQLDATRGRYAAQIAHFPKEVAQN